MRDSALGMAPQKRGNTDDTKTYYDLLLEMSVGERARAWHLNNWAPEDAVYDIWVIDRYPQYETPEPIEWSSSETQHMASGVIKKLLYRQPNAKPIVEDAFKSHPFEISINCWDKTTGNLIATSDLTSLGWSQCVTTTFRMEASLDNWCDRVDFEKHDEPHWDIDDWNQCWKIALKGRKSTARGERVARNPG